ncbi:hypothetical protein AQ751_10790 [Burkholderia pseudomallei]|nr:hypothetical protein AQ724_07510 [Burkholderia pseudomallei]OMR78715.1 hypothetical protein AQ727_15805 [Burkholderia pseudomallei]OMT08181.1 hypothetical protein AQ751_10790 [Burkholderia pseudomallei]OMZ25564.1 hypothetical protein AQ861_05005 [Burkholderia pseudomallei]ONF17791.1 hypothetical protein AQ964_11190 [Burkholderia pseudomallei]
MLSDSFTLTLAPFTSSTVPRRDGSGLDDWLRAMTISTAKLFKEETEVVEISKTTAWGQRLCISFAQRFFQ